MRKWLIVFLSILIYTDGRAQVQNPENYLGYKLGSHYTPHWRIVDYFRYIASAMPSMMKMQTYGYTNEGRPLVAAFVSAPQNISNLEIIRHNNLALTGLSNGKGVIQNTPAIVWLSFNVHGNEASSSEASLLTLWSLIDPSNKQTKEWLQNLVVVIDPCLNPDGRDRYVNWFSSVAGKYPNPLPEAREHSEPWPGGRTNHYYFDLNRDWCWQTQLESQQRVSLYNQWMPEVHVDFHEQGVNKSYYFAPASEPYHNVITPWQRKFQEMIGRNHARYFDAKGWLFFTKEEYDLFYPSYGDTYPLFNGAIGMTFEQAGHSRSGTSILVASGDTLTLYDRLIHHYTTSMSTLEVASKNVSSLLAEFQDYFVKARTNGAGPYKSYIIKNDPKDYGKLEALISLLTKNNIQYGITKSGKYKGYNYTTGKDETFTTRNDILISTLQPKSALIQVLFEPNAFLSDTLTYDITAWSVPYAFGLAAYATREKVLTDSSVQFPLPVHNLVTDAYAYVIPWNGLPAAKLVTHLLRRGVRLQVHHQAFQARGHLFDRGAILLIKEQNKEVGLWNSLPHLADSFHVQLYPVNSGMAEKGPDFGSIQVHPLKGRSIAVIAGEGVAANAVGEVWHFFDQEMNYPVTLLEASTLNQVNWEQFDVLIFPDGVYRFLAEKTYTDQLKSWISRGGNLIAMEGAVAQLSKLDWSIKAKKDDTTAVKDPYALLKKYGNKEREVVSGTTPGSIYKVEIDNTHPLAFGYPAYYYTLKQNDALYDFITEGGWNVGVLKKEKKVAGFVGTDLTKKLRDGLLFGTQEIGKGTATYLTDDVLFRDFWENGKLLFTNAVFLVGQ